MGKQRPRRSETSPKVMWLEVSEAKTFLSLFPGSEPDAPPTSLASLWGQTLGMALCLHQLIESP